MPRIELETLIEAPVERVFDLARSIDAHVASTDGTGERAVGGRTSGLIGLEETVTWEARHLWVRQRLTTRITAVDRPWSFEDRMIQGAFASMHHRHEFTPTGSATLMTDVFDFSAPLGVLGRLAERLVLTSDMTRFLKARNAALKRMAETKEWRRYLPETGLEDADSERGQGRP